MRKKDNKNGREFLEKVEHLIEEQPQEAPQTPPEQEKKKPAAVRERALITYIALLFGVAFVLVLLSFLIQQRDISQLNENANSALSRAEQLQDDNRALSESNQSLQLQIQELQQEQEDMSAAVKEAATDLKTAGEQKKALEEQLADSLAREALRVKAYELLLTAQRDLDEERTDDFQKDMTELAAIVDSLDAQGMTLYQELLGATAVSADPIEEN